MALLSTAPRHAEAAHRGAAADPKRAIVGSVDRDRLERRVGDLSGANLIDLGGGQVRINTRYALSTQTDTVRQYLVDAVRAAGYEPSLQKFMLSVRIADLTGIAVSRGLDTVWTADTDGEVFLATAAGGWSKFEKHAVLGHIVNDLTVDYFGRLWAACTLAGSGYGGLFVSTDGGATWMLRVFGNEILSLTTITFKDPLFGIAAGANGTVVVTADGGLTWSASEPQTFFTQSLTGSATNGPFNYWLTTDTGYLFWSTNLGSTWDNRWLGPKSLRAIDFHGESTGVIVGDSVAYYSRDAGMNWIRVSVPADLHAVRMIDSLRVVAGGLDGKMFLSQDGGATWSRLDESCMLAADVQRIANAGSDRFWFSGRETVHRVDVAPRPAGCTAYGFIDTIWGQNIAFRREGKTRPSHEVLLTAHFDAMSPTPFDCAPGADDNGTGTAAVLECARVLRSVETEKSVEFVLFDGEELGLLGSRYFAGRLDTDRVYEEVVNLDMIGYEPNPTLTCIISARVGVAADSILGALVDSSIASCDIPLSAPLVRGERLTSDHVAFWDVGIPGVLIAEGRRSELTPYYHSCFDVASTINYDFLEACTKAALAAVLDLAGIAAPDTIPPEIALSQNRPNPFGLSTVISYSLPGPAPVELAVYDIAGRRVAVLDGGLKERGSHDLTWDGRNASGRRCASGVYLLRLRAGNHIIVRKAVIVR